MSKYLKKFFNNNSRTTSGLSQESESSRSSNSPVSLKSVSDVGENNVQFKLKDDSSPQNLKISRRKMNVSGEVRDDSFKRSQSLYSLSSDISEDLEIVEEWGLAEEVENALNITDEESELDRVSSKANSFIIKKEEISLHDSLSGVVDLRFASLPPHVQTQMMETTVVMRFQKGDIIINQGDDGGEFYLVLGPHDAQVEVLRISQDSEKLLTRLGCGQYFGQKYLLTNRKVSRSATIRAVTEVILGKVDPENFPAWNFFRMYLLLKVVPIFRTLPETEQFEIFSHMQCQDFVDGEYIVKQGDIGDKFYIIVDGSADIYDETVVLGIQRKKYLTRLYEGHFFGEYALIYDEPRTASVVAVGPTLCLYLSKNDFREALTAQQFKEVMDDVSYKRMVTREKRNDTLSKVSPALTPEFSNSTTTTDFSDLDMSLYRESFSGELPIGRLSQNSNVSTNSNLVRKRLSNGERVINNYILIKEIGKGSFGNVYLARMEGQERFVAVKDVNRPANKWKGPTVDIYKEISVMKLLNHPNIVSLIEVIDDPKVNQVYLIMEFLEGGPLLPDSETTTPIPEEVSREYFRDMLRAVFHMHARGVIHRDIKPQNMLKTFDSKIKVADFGSAVILGSDEKWPLVGGTPAFMAPELFKLTGNDPVSPAIDIWGLGATLYNMVVGKPPWMAVNQLHLAGAVQNYEVTYPSHIEAKLDPHLKNLLKQMLEKDPASRIVLRSVMWHDWVTKEGSYPLDDWVFDDVLPEKSPSLSLGVSNTSSSMNRRLAFVEKEDTNQVFSPHTQIKYLSESPPITPVGTDSDDFNRTESMKILKHESQSTMSVWKFADSGGDADYSPDNAGEEFNANQRRLSRTKAFVMVKTDQLTKDGEVVHEYAINEKLPQTKPLLSKRSNTLSSSNFETIDTDLPPPTRFSKAQSLKFKGRSLLYDGGDEVTGENASKNSSKRLSRSFHNKSSDLPPPIPQPYHDDALALCLSVDTDENVLYINSDDDPLDSKRFQSKVSSESPLNPKSSEADDYDKLSSDEDLLDDDNEIVSLDNDGLNDVFEELAAPVENISIRKDLAPVTPCRFNRDVMNRLKAWAQHTNLRLGLRYGISETINCRDYMEDRTIAKASVENEAARTDKASVQKSFSINSDDSSHSKAEDFAFFGIYDGHEGSYVSEYLRQNLLTKFKECLVENGSIQDTILQSFLQACVKVELELLQKDFERLEEFNKRRLNASQDIGEVNGNKERSSSLENSGTMNLLQSQNFAGSTAVVAILFGGQPYETPMGSPSVTPRSGSELTLTQKSRSSSVSGNNMPYVSSSSTLARSSLQSDRSSVISNHNLSRRSLLELQSGNDVTDSAGGLTAANLRNNSSSTNSTLPISPRSRSLYCITNSKSTTYNDSCDESKSVSPHTPSPPVYLFVAHVGDSRAVLCENGVAVQITYDHKPDVESEKKRIEAAKGWVQNGRVNSVLAVSRSFGDIKFKHYLPSVSSDELTSGYNGDILWSSSNQVVSKPDTVILSVKPTYEFIVLASDGLWEKLSCDEAINYIRRRLIEHGDAQRAAKETIAFVVNSGGSDNISILIICLNQIESKRYS